MGDPEQFDRTDDPVSDEGDDAADDGRRDEPPNDDRQERRVEVPEHVFKRVTVFSTLIAVVLVVGGFVLLDAATDRATAPLSETDPLVALAGLGCIVLGAVTYAFSTRFQAEGMGNAKDESDEPSNNG